MNHLLISKSNAWQKAESSCYVNFICLDFFQVFLGGRSFRNWVAMIGGAVSEMSDISTKSRKSPNRMNWLQIPVILGHFIFGLKERFFPNLNHFIRSSLPRQSLVIQRFLDGSSMCLERLTKSRNNIARGTTDPWVDTITSSAGNCSPVRFALMLTN